MPPDDKILRASSSMRRRPLPPFPALGLWISNAFRKLPVMDRPESRSPAR
jgi:hypothetical protein